MTTQTHNGKVIPAFAVSSIDFDMSKNQMSFSLHGGLIAKIANLLKGLFKGVVVSQINKQVPNQIKSQIPKVLDNLVDKTNGQINFFPVKAYSALTFDMSTPVAPKITSKFIEASFDGTMWDAATGGEVRVAGVQPPATLPTNDATIGSEFQVMISNYFMDSLFDSFMKVAGFSFNADSKVVKTKLPWFSTSGLEEVFPGLVAKYGKDQAIMIEFSVLPLALFTSEPSTKGLRIDAGCDVGMYVQSSNKTLAKTPFAQIKLDSINISASIEVANMQVHGQINDLALNNLTIQASALGKLDLSKIVDFFDNKVFKLGIPFLNIFLAT